MSNKLSNEHWFQQVLEAAELLGIEIDIHVENRNEQTPRLENFHPSPTPGNPEKEDFSGDEEKAAVMEEEQDGTFHCKICDHKASRKGNLNKHIKMIHSGNTPLYQCPSLGCIFKTKEKSHMKSHNKAKHLGVRFDCTFCQYQTPYRKSLGKHVEAKHTGEATPFAFPCELCNFKGFDQAQLRSHNRIKHMRRFYNDQK